jgi:hypothetical protein
VILLNNNSTVLVQPEATSFKLDAYTSMVASMLPKVNYHNMQADVNIIYLGLLVLVTKNYFSHTCFSGWLKILYLV